jgi:hypothetical protein
MGDITMALSENEKNHEAFRKASDDMLKDYKDVSEQLDELKKVTEMVGRYPNPATDVCPGCGRCKHCGHREDYPHYPQYPQYPHYPYYRPVIITCDSSSTPVPSYNGTATNSTSMN